MADELNRYTTNNNGHAMKLIGRRRSKRRLRILSTPGIVDEYYLNLVSWSKSNTLTVPLEQCAYMWEVETGNIKHLLMLRE